MVYLTATLLPYTESEFINVIKIGAQDAHMFQPLAAVPILPIPWSCVRRMG